ncbi:MAG: ribosome-binding factor A [Methylacidiphilales bacterium]|nr:ribosome-binding factor A [Candidatus Methylacidiphilales bacterium]MDW8349192.1 ribosome-binding factor A [Verrucomicrobiae bacterium]
MNTQRTLRVGELILHHLPTLIRQHTDLEGHFITITEVDVTPDLRQAHIYFSILNSNIPHTDILEILQKHRHPWQQQLGKILKTKFTPCLTFHLDDEHQQKTLRLLDILDHLEPNS